MANKKAKPKSDAPAEPFEESLEKLEGIVSDLEGGELGLADSLARYEEGVQRLKSCHAQLEAAERKIELLSGVDADGNPITQPFDDSPTAGGTSRAQKRSAPATPPNGGEDVDDPARLF